MRGEHAAGHHDADRAVGSSPHARGALASDEGAPAVAGIIPACAGSTMSRSGTRCWWRDHPRMRGEHNYNLFLDELDEGSSPHARGARRRRGVCDDARGIIPACAGSTCGSRSWSCPCRDHPRMRGEHMIGNARQAGSEGSSPHARGARSNRAVRRAARRIIPACAGSTWNRGSNGSASRDHPRMRGEHTRASVAFPVLTGSSPHARGAPVNVENDSARSVDHPRMRGEHRLRDLTGLSVRGSSPHARGARRGGEVPRARIGIIPACAGSTWSSIRSRATIRDHPRMRGEHRCSGPWWSWLQGSSPHARGAHRRDRRG